MGCRSDRFHGGTGQFILPGTCESGIATAVGLQPGVAREPSQRRWTTPASGLAHVGIGGEHLDAVMPKQLQEPKQQHD